jgi:antitoxin FitA
MAAMTSIQIKGVPERTHSVLRQRAASAHQSLQEYLLQLLIQEADQATLDEVLDAASRRSGGSFTYDDINEILRADRDSH